VGLDSPLSLTGEEFKSFLAQIESYFHVEYAILLDAIADLAALSVVLSGDAADWVNEPININRFIWNLMLVSPLCVLMALASLVGAFAGSKRTLGGCGADPVGRLRAVLLFVAINGDDRSREAGECHLRLERNRCDAGNGCCT
jgi:hypothetical protein